MKKISRNLMMGLLLALSVANVDVQACTNFLITKGASKDGSTMVTYAADSHTLYGELYFRPAAIYPAGTMVDVYEWDTGKKLGTMKQAEQTYSVVGNMNEFQLAISETTYGGRDELVDTAGIIDYGTLIYTTLQRAKTAREAIKVISELLSEYGYASSGESLSISDPNEVWILELIGKGQRVLNSKGAVDTKKWTKGAVWVALRIPDGYISGHANQARITTFPKADGKTSITSKDLSKVNLPDITCVYSYDVVDYATNIGLFKGKHEEFSFSDTYAPLTFSAARGCEARVWAGFMRVNPIEMKKYETYARGADLTNRMPLWIAPDHLLTVQDVMGLMRDHYEGTSLDMTQDVGAGPFTCPYRWRPMSWEYNGEQYIHERATSTQQTGFSFVTQSKSYMPNPVGGVIWFGVDDTYSTCYAPIYCGVNQIPNCFKEGNGDMLTYSPTSAFWLFNLVTNFAYSRYSDMIKDIQKVQSELENNFVQRVEENDKAWRNETDHARLVQEATRFSMAQSQYMFNRWKRLSEYLLVKYIDGNIKKEKDGRFENNGFSPKQPAFPLQPKYPDWFYKQIVEQTGTNLKVVE